MKLKPNEAAYDKEYDIVVVGLGTAGAISLITAAKRGLKVLGIEALNAMGGTGTLGAISGYYFGARGGLYESVNAMEQTLQEGMYIESSNPRYDTKEYALEQMAVHSGADILYETRVTEVFGKDKEVEGVCCYSNGKPLRIRSKMLIDGTGDAYICHLAGCLCNQGRQFDGQTQPYSNMAIVTKNKAVYSLNKDSGYVNQHDCIDQSQKIIDSTAMLMHIMQNSGPENTFLTNASLLGVRQGRTIVGEETISLKSFLENQHTKRPIFFAYSNVDNHGKDTAFEDDILLDWYVAAGLWEICFSVGVTSGMLIPQEYRGILVAGRCLSVDHNIASCIRMKSDMEKCGEAAAELACLAIENKVAAKDVDYHQLAKRLMETKCLDHTNDVGFLKKQEEHQLVPFSWHTDIDTIIRELGSDRPGIAIWSAKRMGEDAIQALKKCLQSEEKLLKKNAAIALGLLYDPSACETLRDMVISRDSYVPKTSFKYSYMHAITAIYLLGKLADKESVEILLDVIRKKGIVSPMSFVPDHFYTTEEDVQFQYISYALVALSKIAQKHPEIGAYIKKSVVDELMKDELSITITLKANPYIKYDMADKIKSFIRSFVDFCEDTACLQ